MDFRLSRFPWSLGILRISGTPTNPGRYREEYLLAPIQWLLATVTTERVSQHTHTFSCDVGTIHPQMASLWLPFSTSCFPYICIQLSIIQSYHSVSFPSSYFSFVTFLSASYRGGRFTVIDHSPVSDLRVENCRVKLHSLQKNLFRLHMSQKSLLLRTDTL